MDQRQRMVTAIITLPLFYNPDRSGKRRAVEPERFYHTMIEIDEKFGGCRVKGDREVIQGLLGAFETMTVSSVGTPTQLGSWLSGGRLYIDPEIELEVEVSDS